MSHTVDMPLCVIPAVVDVDYRSDQFVVDVHPLAVFLSHCSSPCNYTRHGMTTNWGLP
ncbi:hypothetical protein PSI19_00280 [Xenorhabdus khoisanae]|uniref:hypothetical protein n=1 Tax=Xenorhabdus khoisanae TaxID=880157 RepID=UPI0023598D5F|nr:hypothetical protein [Xenorhabdus khoisanae]MDC9612347.1 hypothetical protein [Xenorhabdus khoisanae]